MKINGRTSYNGNILETVLRNRGIEDIELFLNPSPDNPLDDRLKAGMKRAIEVLLEHIEKKSKILAIVDSDVDGMTSSAIFVNYLYKTFPKINLEYIFHSKKAHGFTDDIVEKINDRKPDLVFCIDAGTNDVEPISLLSSQGIDIIVIDHHEMDNPSDDCILINNQLDNCPNKKLTGAGLSLRFCQQIDLELGKNNSDRLWELAMLGLLGDSADLINNEVRFICDTAKSNIKNSLISRALKQSWSKKDKSELSYIDFSFGVIPLINAVCRMGTLEEKEIVFKALADIDKKFKITLEKRKLNKETRKYEMKEIEFDLYSYALDVCAGVKTRQDKFADTFIKNNIIDNSGDVIVLLSEEDLFGLTGLIAGKIASLYSKPTLVMQKIGNEYTGSGRGYEKALPSLKAWCEKTGLFSLVQGHSNAHGVAISLENIDELLKLTSIGDIEEIVHDVDFIYENIIPLEDIELIDKSKKLFGGGNVKEAEFGIVNMKVAKKNITLKGASTLKIFCEGISFVKYKSSKEEYEKIISNFASHICFDVICRVEVAIYNGKKYHQGIISAFQSRPDENLEIYF